MLLVNMKEHSYPSWWENKSRFNQEFKKKNTHTYLHWTILILLGVCMSLNYNSLTKFPIHSVRDFNSKQKLEISNHVLKKITFHKQSAINKFCFKYAGKMQ